MEKLAIFLGLNGLLVLLVSTLCGLFLWRALGKGDSGEDWHLIHAGGSARAIMLLGIAAIIHLLELSPTTIWLGSWLILLFVWTSMAAMLTRAITGENGFGNSGSIANRIVFLLYAIGIAAVFPGMLILIFGLGSALL